MTQPTFKPGQIWLDTAGKPIQAHGGGILFDKGTYYWYGENRETPTRKIHEIADWDCKRTDVIGISCYSSPDLYHWKNEGVVLTTIPDDPAHDLHPSKVVERPKVIYNDSTGKYVMWLHIDTWDYKYAATGVAISDNPTGPFRYLGSFKPNGADSRDMTVFKDSRGEAYLFHSSEWNKTMYVTPLADDYLSTGKTLARIFIDQSREAPAVFKRNGKYHIITSGCTGWDPNQAQSAVADAVTGPWETQENPCRGKDAAITFYAQSTFVFPVAGYKDAYIFMADIWNKDDLENSRYVWLPVRFEGDSPVIEWRDEWDLSVFNSD